MKYHRSRMNGLRDYNRHADMPAELQYTWKGTTTFMLKDGFESTLEDVVAPPPEHPDTLQEARRARRARGRPQPTQARQEMEEHALTHACASSKQKLLSKNTSKHSKQGNKMQKAAIKKQSKATIKADCNTAT